MGSREVLDIAGGEALVKKDIAVILALLIV